MHKTKLLAVQLGMCFSFLLFILPGFAQDIKGVIADSITGEPMTGATVTLKPGGIKQMVQLNGTFRFKKIPAGTYQLEVVFTGYRTLLQVVITDGHNDVEVKIQLETQHKELDGVTVSGGNRSSERNARLLEKNADQQVNIISQGTIRLLPDLTVANVLQRVSGVSIEKSSSGEGRYPIIRGMEKRYVNTLINGIKIPSPDNKSRFIPLDLFPSELLERLEVNKTLIPSAEGDAIGGTINLVMKDAPVNKLVQFNFSTGYNNIFNKQDFSQFDKGLINKKSPNEINGPAYASTPAEFSNRILDYKHTAIPVNSTFGLTLGNRFGKYKRWGVLVSASYQNQYRGTSTTVFTTSSTSNVDNVPAFEYLMNRQYSQLSKRLGVTAKMDYRFNNKNKISLFTTYVRLSDIQVRNSTDTTNAINQTLSYSSRSTWQYQSIYNNTLQGIHQLTPTLTADWSAAYSVAHNAMPDQTSFSHGGLSVDRTGPVVALQGDDILSSMSRTWVKNSDKDLSGYLNLTRQFRLFNTSFELKAGGLYRDKKRNNTYYSYTLNPLRIAGANQLYTSVDEAQFTFLGSDPTAHPDGNTYTFKEDISAGYVQGKWQLSHPLELLGGVRLEHTSQHYHTALPLTTNYAYGAISYTDWLPSMQFKYRLTDKQALRLSYYRAIARPQFAELIPDGPAYYELFKEIGNPQGLQHTTADNYDLRYEFFPDNVGEILIGAFYKRIQDPIELSIRKSGYNSQVFMPVNIGKAASNYGIEAVYTKYFGIWGISANYTYTHSRITNDSMLYKYRDPSLGITDKYVSETRPLQGQANHIGNLSVLYKNPKNGLEAQVAFVYTGERLSVLNTYKGLHYWLQPTSQIDLSFEKKIQKKCAVYAKVNNLTNTPIVTSIHYPYNLYMKNVNVPLSMQTDPAHKTIVQKDYYRTSFLIGFRYKL